MNKHTAHIMQFFAYTHLPERLQAVSEPFCDLAKRIGRSLPDNPEKTIALRKLLEAKDAAVRAVLAKVNRPEVDRTCDYCGVPTDEDNQVLECPECQRPGCLECMPAGNGCTCPECEEKEER